jgi:dGTPase
MAKRSSKVDTELSEAANNGRSDRFHGNQDEDSPRSPFERDRDRILYTTAFRRLAGVTQVVGPGEGHVYHNRLTHTLEVAQIALRLAQRLIKDNKEVADLHGGIDTNVVEAAALAHDLGHPPFGHVAEVTLNKLVTQETVLDGFEGNAQSFRIVTKLSVRSEESIGLNLTRATLDATLKYPCIQEPDLEGKQKVRKWGAYSAEREEFQFARAGHPAGEGLKGLECEVMDWADDIAYSIHDTEDFYRAGLIPLDRLATNEDVVSEFLESVFDRRRLEGIRSTFEDHELSETFRDLCKSLPITEPYRGTRSQRASLRAFTSQFIGQYVLGTSVTESRQEDSLLKREAEHLMQITMLKELTWHYVIKSSALAGQQFGQQKAIETLFSIFREAVREDDHRYWARLPERNREDMASLYNKFGKAIPDGERIRVVADAIAGMTDQQAVLMYQRFMGIAPGSSFDSIV